jgi:GAF domain-containing protein
MAEEHSLSDGTSARIEAAVGALARVVPSAEDSFEATMLAVASLGRSAHDRCDVASITVMERGRPMTVAATDPVAAAIDEAQYAAGSGPCVQAIVDKRVVRSDRLDEDHRWTEVAGAAQEVGIAASLSTPMLLDGVALGGLNYYGFEPSSFTAADEAISVRFAAQAAVVASNATAYWSVEATSRQLQAALESRAVIEQAKGFLVATLGGTPDEAFELLRRASQKQNRKLRDLAVELISTGAWKGA